MTRKRALTLVALLLVLAVAFTAYRVAILAVDEDVRATLATERRHRSAAARPSSLHGTPPAEVEVTSARHLEPVRLSAATVRHDPTAPIGTLAGTVVAFASSAPIASATLTFAHDDHTMAIESDADGHFVFAAPELGTYTLATASAEGFLPFAPEWGHSPVRFEARPGVHVEGLVVYLVNAVETVATVVRGDGSPRGTVPVAGAEVRIRGGETGERALMPLASRLVSDAHGEVRFVAPDDALLEASHPVYGRGRAVLDTAAQLTHHMTVRLVRDSDTSARDAQRIAGIVVDDHGEPIDGALVVGTLALRPGSADAQLHASLEGQTDDEGHFALEGADDGVYQLITTAAGHARNRLAGVRAGAEDVVVRMGAEATLRVRVVDSAGAPVAATTVLVERVTGPMTTETLGVVSSYDAEGSVDVAGLEPGPCRVVASAPGYAPSAPVDAVARSGAPTVVVVRLTRGGRIVGRVVSAGPRGAPIEGARVTLEGRLGSGPSAVPLETSALTDHAGAFLLAGVVPGLHSIVAWAEAHHGRIRSGLQLAADAELDAGTIDLTPLAEGEHPQLELAGIGAVLAAEGDALVIGQVLDGGGAAAAGLVIGDGIVEVDGVPVVDLGFGGTIERIRGPEGGVVPLSAEI